MWIIWLTSLLFARNATNFFMRFFVDNQKISAAHAAEYFVGIVDNYSESSETPTESMGPAPIVINISLFLQCSEKYFSIVENSPK